tara:strand:- start:1162 stop:1797 length:636 start_codon:yes stop_codon:yes gene_type:complete
MWAYVKSNKIEEIIRFPKTMVINNITHSRRIFTSWSWTELNKIGIYTVEDGTKGNDNFEYTSQPTYIYSASDKKVTTKYTTTDKALDDSEAKDEDGNNILDEKGNKTYNYGLKTQAKEKVKQQANSLINRFNWLVERSIYDSSKSIPDAVKTYVASIRTDCANIEKAIDDASDMSAFRKLYDWEYNEDGSVKTIAPIQNWSDDYDVKTYIR